jgi:Zn-finger protein
VDDKVFSLPTAFDEIMRLMQGDDCCYTISHSYSVDEEDSTQTIKTRNSAKKKKCLTKLQNFIHTKLSDESVVSLTELQQQTNQTAQRIQREFERKTEREFERKTEKSAHDHSRYLYERYGNRTKIVKFYDMNKEFHLQ